MQQKTGHDYRAKILLLGESYSGKSALIDSYCLNSFTEMQSSATMGIYISQPTIKYFCLGIDYRQKKIEVNKKIVQAGIYDSNLLYRFKDIVIANLRHINGFILVYSVLDRKTFLKLKEILKLLEDQEVGHLPRVLVGTKIDRDEYDPAKEDQELLRKVSYDEAEEFAEKNGMLYFEVSCAKFKEIHQPFEALLGIIIEKFEAEEGEKMRKKSFVLRVNKPRNAGEQSKCSSRGP